MNDSRVVIHASCVVLHGKALLITGPSGSGKSSLALRLIALGAELVADDRTILTLQGEALMATVPDSIAGLIEARGVGLLRIAHSAGPHEVKAVVDIGTSEEQRLPTPHRHSYLGVSLPCLHNADSPHFAAAMLLYMRGDMMSSDD